MSQDILKVVPDKAIVPPGFLFAFLSSKYGIPQVVSGTFGSIIVHIEAENIADLPVPRMGSGVEGKAHALVERAADNRSRASALRQVSQEILRECLALPDMSTSGTPLTFSAFAVSVGTVETVGRLDASHYSPFGVVATEALEKCEPTELLGTIARVFQTNIFKRPFVSDGDHGFPYFSGVELFAYDPEPRGFLRKKAHGIRDYLVQKDWLLMQDAGQLGGLFGRLVRVTRHQDGSVVSNHLIRIVPTNRADAAYLFALLGSSVGYRAILRNAFGSSIPQLESAHLARIRIPWPEATLRRRISDPILESWDLEDEAIDLERDAVEQVERAIEESA